jgi:MFS family permease
MRDRWINFLDPKVNKAPWTVEEDQQLRALQGELGSSWAEIARRMPGRASDIVKARFNLLSTSDGKRSPDSDVSTDWFRKKAAEWGAIDSTTPQNKKQKLSSGDGDAGVEVEETANTKHNQDAHEQEKEGGSTVGGSTATPQEEEACDESPLDVDSLELVLEQVVQPSTDTEAIYSDVLREIDTVGTRQLHAVESSQTISMPPLEANADQAARADVPTLDPLPLPHTNDVNHAHSTQTQSKACGIDIAISRDIGDREDGAQSSPFLSRVLCTRPGQKFPVLCHAWTIATCTGQLVHPSEDASIEAQNKRQWYRATALQVVGMLNAFTEAFAFSFLLPLTQIDLGAEEVDQRDLGIPLRNAFATAAIFILPFVGCAAWSDSRATFISCTLLSICSSLSFVFKSDINSIVVARAIQGVTSAGNWMASLAMLSENFHGDELSVILQTMYVYQSVGSIAGGAMGSLTNNIEWLGVAVALLGGAAMLVYTSAIYTCQPTKSKNCPVLGRQDLDKIMLYARCCAGSRQSSPAPSESSSIIPLPRAVLLVMFCFGMAYFDVSLCTAFTYAHQGIESTQVVDPGYYAGLAALMSAGGLMRWSLATDNVDTRELKNAQLHLSLCQGANGMTILLRGYSYESYNSTVASCLLIVGCLLCGSMFLPITEWNMINVRKTMASQTQTKQQQQRLVTSLHYESKAFFEGKSDQVHAIFFFVRLVHLRGAYSSCDSSTAVVW